jgi:hypothetical protein
MQRERYWQATFSSRLEIPSDLGMRERRQS